MRCVLGCEQLDKRALATGGTIMAATIASLVNPPPYVAPPIGPIVAPPVNQQGTSPIDLLEQELGPIK